MKKIIALLLAMIMVLCMFAGCANETETPADDQTETNDTPATTPSDDEGEEEEDNTQEEEQAPAESETPVVFPWMQAIGIDTYFENPHQDNQSFMTQLLFQPLQEHNAVTGEYVDMVGTNWQVSDDYLTFSIDVLDGWTWHDGEPVTTDDVIFSLYDAALNPNSTQQGGYDKVVGIEATRNGETDTIEGIWAEGNTVYVQLTEPNAHWNFRGLFLLPAHCFEGVAWADVNFHSYWESPIGCGRMKITEVSMPDYFMCTRYEGYAGTDPVGFKNAKFVAYDTGAVNAAVTALMTGELDFAGRQIVIDGDTAASISAQNPDVVCMGMTAFSHRVFVANMGNWRADGKDNSYMQDARVRKAIDLLIDQDKIAAMYPGAAVATKTITPASSAEYAADLVADYPSYDPDQAKALLDEAGFDYNNTIDLFYYYDDQLTHDIMAMVAQDFAAAGVTLNYQVYTDNLAALIYEDKNYDIIYCAMGTDSIYNTSCMFQLTSGASYTYMGDSLDGRWERLDALYAAYNATIDPDELKDYARQAQAENLENCWMMPGYYQAFFSGYNSSTLSIPLEYFETYSTSYLEWSSWKVLK